MTEIKSIFHEFKSRYGSPRVHAELIDRGIKCSLNTVARIMSKYGLKAVAKKKFKAATSPKHSYQTYPNILNQNFKIDAPNKVWTTDITYIRTQEGWAYLNVIIDLFSRKIIGWSLDKSLHTNIAITSIRKAFWDRKPKPGLIHHSDRGVQYASFDYQMLLKLYKMKCSMSKKGDCYDNAVTESFFHTLKVELINQNQYPDIKKLYQDIYEYIEMFYNTKRKHTTLGMLSPSQFEREYLENNAA